MYKDFAEFIYKDNDIYKCRLERFDGNYYVHIEVKDKSLSSMKRIKEDFFELLDWLSFMGINELFSYTHNLKFCKWVCEYEYVGETPYIPEEGKSYHIVVWRYK